MEYAPTLQRGGDRRDFVSHLAVIAILSLIAAACPAQTATAGPGERPGFQDLQNNPAWLTEFGQLIKKMQEAIQVPAPRRQSRLLPLLPESTVFYAAFPNYGEAARQALTIFQQEVKDNPELRSWWQTGELGVQGPQVEDALEKIDQIAQYLGDEIVVSGSTDSRQEPSLLMLAAVRKPGLKDALQKIVKELGGKSQTPIPVVDLEELAAAGGKFLAQQLVILVRPDYVVATLNVEALRSFNSRLGNSAQDFATTPFAARILQVYEGGTTVVAGVDLQTLLKLAPSGADQNRKILERSGFADMKYLVWEHKSVPGQATSQVELGFTGPRGGAASWLAAPGLLDSLDFVSPKAILATAFLLKKPAEIFDEVKQIATVSNPNAFAGITQMEQGLKLNLRDDLLGRLDGEIAVELDRVAPGDALWKTTLKVNDPERLQAVLTSLLAAAPVKAQQSEDDGVTYHTLQIPSGQKTMEIGYAFVDGYLVVASSREAVAEAVGLHRSGESLGKSRRFMAALPPADSSRVSGLLYEDPIRMAALNLQRLSPAMAQSFSNSKPTAESTPAVMAFYGEDSAIRESSNSTGVDVGVVLVGAAVAIPNLLRARIAAQESTAVATVRTANTAQIIYSNAYPDRGFARDLATLGTDSGAPAVISAEHAGLLGTTTWEATCLPRDWCTKSGFRFHLTAVCKTQRCGGYVVVGTPLSLSTGSRSFCSIADGVVRFHSGPPLTTPISALECRAWPPLK